MRRLIVASVPALGVPPVGVPAGAVTAQAHMRGISTARTTWLRRSAEHPALRGHGRPGSAGSGSPRSAEAVLEGSSRNPGVRDVVRLVVAGSVQRSADVGPGVAGA